MLLITVNIIERLIYQPNCSNQQTPKILGRGIAYIFCKYKTKKIFPARRLMPA